MVNCMFGSVSRPPGGVNEPPGGDVGARLVQSGFHLVGQFQAVFVKIIEPGLQLLDFVVGQLGNGRFDLLHRTHAENDSFRTAVGKRQVSVVHRGCCFPSNPLRLGAAAIRIAALAMLWFSTSLFAAEDGARLTLKRRAADGVPVLELSGANGGTYRIEASEDLRHWQALTTNTLNAPRIEFLDPAGAPLARRFYRAVRLDASASYEPGIVLLRFQATANDAGVAGVFDAVPLTVAEEIWTSAMQDDGQDPV
jgi:hypothetical protein